MYNLILLILLAVGFMVALALCAAIVIFAIHRSRKQDSGNGSDPKA